MDSLFLIQAYLFVPSLILLILQLALASQVGPLWQRQRTDDMVFIGMLAVLIICSSCDIITLALYAMGFSNYVELACISTTIVMLMYLVFIYLWTLFIDFRLYKSKKRFKRIRGINMIPLFFVSGLLVFNHFTELVFSIDDQGGYHVEPFWFIYVLVEMIYVFATSIFLQKYKRISGGLHFFPVRSFVIPFVLGTIGEIIIPGMSLTMAGATIGFVMIFLGMLRENIYEDQVTGFYNSFFLQKISEEAENGTFDFSSGILLYADDFVDCMNRYGIVETNKLMWTCAMALRDDLPENCETMYLETGRILIITKVSKEQESAITMLIDIMTTNLTEASGGALTFKGCFAYRGESQDPGSLLSDLAEKAVA